MPPPAEQLAILPRTECKPTIDEGGLSKMIGVQDLASEVHSPAGEAVTQVPHC